MVQFDLDFFQSIDRIYERQIFTLRFQEQNQPFDPPLILPFLGTLVILAAVIFMRQSCSQKLQVTCKAKPSCKDFDCFQLQGPFHMKVVEALMEATFLLPGEFTRDLSELICYWLEFCLIWLESFSW